MPFIIGVALGFAAGFAGAVLFADHSRKGEAEWPSAAVEPDAATIAENHDVRGAVQRTLRALQDHVNEALKEARQASAEAEVEMRARYEKTTRRKAPSGKK